jgi:hypothetical protein
MVRQLGRIILREVTRGLLGILEKKIINEIFKNNISGLFGLLFSTGTR